MPYKITLFDFISIKPIDEQLVNSEKIVHNKKSRRNKIKFDRDTYESKRLVWDLKNYSGERINDGIDWQYQSSANKLNDELKAEEIAKIINSDNKFDFDYLPKENDLLTINFEYKIPQLKNKIRPFINYYISFLFNEGGWNVNNGYDHIDKEFSDFKNGVIKYVAQHCV